MSPSTEPLIDFALFTAIEIERRAVCKAFRLTDKHRVFKENRVYWRGQLPLRDGGLYEIAVAQSPDMGNIDAAVLATSMIHDWSPGALLLVGIAGAGSTDQKLGDLALGRDVYYHERGKETPTGTKLEPYMYRADALLWNRVTTLPDWRAKIPVARPDGKSDHPQIHFGVIASGERVIADIATRDQIAAGQRKIVAIEMEGHGVSAALWQSVDRVRGLVIRAICDLADASKNSEWHPYAAAVAAGFAKHFLLDQPLEPRNASQTAPTKRVRLTLAMDFAAFDSKAERILVHALAGFLDIPPGAVKVCSSEEGSVKVIIELPADAAERLLKAGEAGALSLPASLGGGDVRVAIGPEDPDPAQRFLLYQQTNEARERAHAATTPKPTSRALALWQEKLAFLQEQEAIVADPAQKYALRIQIQEAEEKIRELTR